MIIHLTEGGKPKTNYDAKYAARVGQEGKGSGGYDRSLALSKSIAESEYSKDTIESNEHTTVVTPDGKIIFRSNQEEGHPDMPYTYVSQEEAEGRQLEGNYSFHNHPTGIPPHNDDLAWCSKYKARGMVVVGNSKVEDGNKYIYTILPPEGMSTFNEKFFNETIAPAYLKAWERLYRKLPKKIKAKDVDSYYGPIRDDAWLETAKQTGIRYYKQKW